MTATDLLAEGQRHHQNGRLAQAEQCYRRAVAAAPESAAAWALLGAACLMQGRGAEAVAHCRAALERDPRHAPGHDNLGIALASSGKAQEAVASFLRAVDLDPRNVGTRSNLAGVLEHLGRRDEAADHLRAALAIDPNRADLAQRLARLGPPSNADANFRRGTAAVEAGRLAEGVDLLREAVRLMPAHVAARYNYAVAVARLGRLDDAATALAETLRLQPDHADAYNCLGMVRAQERRLTEAVAAFRESLRLKPGNAEALSNLGIACWELDQRPEALAAFEESVRLRPDLVAGWTNLSIALASRGDPEAAVDACRKARALVDTPATRVLDAFTLPIVYKSAAEVADWRGRVAQRINALVADGTQLDVRYESPPTLFYLAYQGGNDRDLLRAAGRLLRPPPDPPTPKPLAHGGKKIRVAFLSCYFRNHTVGELMRGVVANLSRRDFEVIALSIGKHDDEVARFVRAHCDRFVELPYGLDPTRKTIRDLAPDVLFYTDIGMDRVTYALCFSRLAPVQCVTWGHPSTSGSPALDAFVSSALFEADDAESHYTERLVRLKGLPFWCYRPTPPVQPKTREQLGLPADAHIYGCPQSLFKFHPDFDALLAALLRGDPKGIVVLNRDRHPFYGHWEAILRGRFARSMPDVAERVVFLPRLGHEDYLSLNLVTDVLLDPLHFTGGNTSLKALGLGVPIVTLPGPLMKSRMTAAFYRRMGVTDGVAATPEEYVRLALRLGTEPDYRRSVAAKIKEASGVLYDNAEPIRELEEYMKGVVGRA